MSRRGILATLVAYMAVSFLDRQILAIVLSQIGVEFKLTDLQLGLLSGLAFAILFSVMTIPFSLIVSRVSRRLLLISTIFVWSASTLFGGFAQGFTHLFLSRLGVGFGEGGATPTAHSVISELYEEHERTTAMSIYTSGANIGVALALVGGSLIAQFWGWRIALISAGVPGLLLALFIRLKFPEFKPARQTESTPMPRKNVRFLPVLKRLWSSKPERLSLCAAAFCAATVFAGAAWVPTFLVRIHELQIATVGLFLALVIGLGGAAATILSGWLSDKFGARGRQWVLWVPAILILVGKPFAVLSFLTPSVTLALALTGCVAIFGGAYFSSIITIIHSKLTPAERPVGSSITVILVNLIGLSAGSVFVGFMSDLIASDGSGLGMALALSQGFAIIGVFFLWRAGISLRDG